MPQKLLCPKCHGQRTTFCLACYGTGQKSIVGIKIENCKECDGTGRRRCDVCGGTGEVEPANSKVAQSHALDRNKNERLFGGQ